MKRHTKKPLPPDKSRRFLEPGPVLLLSSSHKEERDIMTLGWHMMLDYTRVGCFIWDQNHSHSLIRKSRQCVINLPTADMVNTVIDIGNTHGPHPDKFKAFNLTPLPASKGSAPLIAECHANFECKLIDTSLINKYSLFVFEIVKAHVAPTPKFPTTLHYRGDGIFMISGPNKNYRKRFKPINL